MGLRQHLDECPNGHLLHGLGVESVNGNAGLQQQMLRKFD